jgi:hypothetical protein
MHIRYPCLVLTATAGPLLGHSRHLRTPLLCSSHPSVSSTREQRNGCYPQLLTSLSLSAGRQGKHGQRKMPELAVPESPTDTGDVDDPWGAKPGLGTLDDATVWPAQPWNSHHDLPTSNLRRMIYTVLSNKGPHPIAHSFFSASPALRTPYPCYFLWRSLSQCTGHSSNRRPPSNCRDAATLRFDTETVGFCRDPITTSSRRKHKRPRKQQ